MEKDKLLELFNEVLKKLEIAESYTIQDTVYNFEKDYNLEDLENDIREYKRLFEEILNS